MWENFWHHFYQRSQSLERDFKALSCTPTQYWMFVPNNTRTRVVIVLLAESVP